MKRKNELVKILAFGLAAAFLVWLSFGGYILAVSRERANINQTAFKVELGDLWKNEKEVFSSTGFYFWPAWPKSSEVVSTPEPTATLLPTSTQQPTATPWPTFTPGPTDKQSSYGFYRHCEVDPNNPYKSICKDYNFTIDIVRDNCGEDLCPATILFTNEFGDTMWVDYFDTKVSIEIHNGDTVLLPGLNLYNWGVGSALPFFDPTVTPQP